MWELEEKIQIWWKMKAWGEGQVSWRLLNIKDEVEEAYGNELDLGGPYEGYKNIS